MGSGIGFDWPVIARDAELAEIARALNMGAGVLLTGEPSVGKSALLRAVLEREQRGGARALDIGRLDPSSPRHAAQPVSGRGQRLIIVADDVRTAAPATLAAACRLIAGGHALLLAAESSRAPLSADMRRLLTGTLIHRVKVGPLDRSGIAKALRTRLGAPVAVETAERFWDASGGNIRVLQDLTERSLTDGSLRRVGNLWRWTGLPAVPDDGLVGLVDLVLGRLTRNERELVAVLALAGPLDTTLSLVVGLAEAAESLDRRGVVTVEHQGLRKMLRLTHGLCAHVVPCTLPADTVGRLRARIADAVKASGIPRPADPARFAALRLGLNDRPTSAGSVTSAAEALHGEDYVLAEALCRTALKEAVTPPTGRSADGLPPCGVGLRTGGGPPATFAVEGGTSEVGDLLVSGTGSRAGAARGSARGADGELLILLGEALAGQRRCAEAEAEFLEADRVGVAADLRPRLVRSRVRNLAVGLGRLAEAQAVLDAEGAVRAGQADRHLEPRALLGLLAGRLDTLPTTSSSYALMPTGSVPPPAALALHEGGGSQASLALLESGAPARDAGLDHLVVSAWITLHACGGAEALGILDILRDHVGAGPRRCMYLALLEARIHRTAGRTARAVELFRQAAAQRGPAEWFVTRSWRLAQLAGALAEQGETAEALSVLEQARTAEDEELAHLLATNAVLLEAATVAACAGDRSTTVRQALGVAQQAAAAGWSVQALAALHLTARAGAAVRAAMLLPAASAGCVPDAVVVRHIRALAVRDGDALDGVAEDFAGLGRLPLAAEAAAQAARVHQTGGDRLKARASQATSAALASRCDVSPPDWTVPTPGGDNPVGPQLTSRECEIATLAAAHLSNQEIADRLVLSVRTVENHLYRAFAKLGVTTRAELPRRLAPDTLRSCLIA
ncbi:LuxR family transcriptional regulator [Streptomyces sp. NPDC051576]|uniref:helix-turn-helix transcriptional regulator n=1 Tax=Streptomyces sp. NPDC051576 TaxID=3155803 RepID=UPI00342CF469